MKYYEWKKFIINNYQKEKENDMKQFGIRPIDDTTNTGKNLICSNVFGTNNNNTLESIINSEEEVAIIVGFGGTGNLHLGHLLLSNELKYYLTNIKHPKFYFVNFEINYDIEILNQMKKLSESANKHMKYEIIDYNNLDVLKLKRKISQFLNINTVNRVMGWKNEKMQSYEKMLDMLTTFSLGSILQEKHSLILIDINQKTYYALYKQIENKINKNLTCFVYHILFPSLKSPIERMSIKKAKSLIYLTDSYDKIESKLKKSYSGMENKEATCSFLRVADLVLSENDMTILINDCIKNINICNTCKNVNAEIISKKIIKRRV